MSLFYHLFFFRVVLVEWVSDLMNNTHFHRAVIFHKRVEWIIPCQTMGKWSDSSGKIDWKIMFSQHWSYFPVISYFWAILRWPRELNALKKHLKYFDNKYIKENTNNIKHKKKEEKHSPSMWHKETIRGNTKSRTQQCNNIVNVSRGR